MKKNIFLAKFKKDPLGLILRAFQKIVVAPLKYKKGDNYDAQKYWQDRFSRYGLSIRGAGDEGFSEEENEKMYKKAAEKITNLLKKEKINLQNIKVLDIGIGTGFYTQVLKDLGVKNYTGVDITDVLFSDHRKEFPEYKFLKRDITSNKLSGRFDLVLMIDVIEHIVTDSGLDFAMANIKKILSEDGTFLISPIFSKGRKHLFYVRSWEFEDIKKRFKGYTFRKLVSFRGTYLSIIKKNMDNYPE